MAKRYYYDCPVQALWMNREFGVEFYSIHDRHGECAVNQEDILRNFHKYIEEKLYVVSELIFEPKLDDEGRIQTKLGFCYARFDGTQWVGHGVNQEKDPSINMRDNKHFFAAKEADE